MTSQVGGMGSLVTSQGAGLVVRCMGSGDQSGKGTGRLVTGQKKGDW